MQGNLFVARRKSQKGYYNCVVFEPDDKNISPFIVTFDQLIQYRMAQMENVAFDEYVEDQVHGE